MLLRPLFFTSFLIDDQLDDDGLADRGPGHDLERLEQDGDRRRVPARPARRGRAGRRSPPREAPSSSRASASTAGRSPTTTIASLEAGPGHLRRRRRRRRGPPRRPRALRRRARPQHGRRRSPTGRRSAPGATASSPARRRPSSSRPTASSSARRTGAAAGLETRVADAWHPFCEWIGRLARGRRRRRLRGRPARLPRRARGPRRPADGARPLALGRKVTQTSTSNRVTMKGAMTVVADAPAAEENRASELVGQAPPSPAGPIEPGEARRRFPRRRPPPAAPRPGAALQPAPDRVRLPGEARARRGVPDARRRAGRPGDHRRIPTTCKSLFTAKPEQAPSLTGESPLRPIVGPELHADRRRRASHAPAQAAAAAVPRRGDRAYARDDHRGRRARDRHAGRSASRSRSRRGCRRSLST